MWFLLEQGDTATRSCEIIDDEHEHLVSNGATFMIVVAAEDGGTRRRCKKHGHNRTNTRFCVVWAKPSSTVDGETMDLSTLGYMTHLPTLSKP